MMKVSGIDHLVLTVADISVTVDFYQSILGMESESFLAADGTQRWALKFGCQKINLHETGKEFRPFAGRPTSGSADLCFTAEMPLEAWLQHLAEHDIPIEAGIVARTGAQGPIRSVYIRDPDGNLIEISNYTSVSG